MKITIAAVVAVAALGFTACSESKPAEVTTTSTTIETPAAVVETPAPAVDPAVTAPVDPAAVPPVTTESTTTTTTTTPAETH